MKLSPAKIDSWSHMLIDQLTEMDGVLLQASDGELLAGMQEIIRDELQVEERLDDEIHKILQAYKYEITQGRVSQDEMFRRIKIRLINERKLVL